ncbi:MAG: type I-C CRISPR-associated protein Cas5 [Alphaproteobacteria bacterium]|nr:type I-C CRISPR-associated protein Cas5 [Alphaproteobacteria bacterium]
MSYGIKLIVSGERACFTRPEMKSERVSYDVITPSAARGIIEAIHWKPAIRWRIDRIRVLNPIRFENVRRNELGTKMSRSTAAAAMRGRGRLETWIEEDRQQRVSTILRDVQYVVEAHFQMTARAEDGDNPAKHLEMVTRRARAGQCFQQPCLGAREFPARIALLEGAPPEPHPDLAGERDLGWMLLDLDFADPKAPQPAFFRARMVDGVIDVPERPGGGR